MEKNTREIRLVTPKGKLVQLITIDAKYNTQTALDLATHKYTNGREWTKTIGEVYKNTGYFLIVDDGTFKRL